MSINIKPLNPQLIAQANMQSFGGKRGDIAARDYDDYCNRVLSWGLSEHKTQRMIDRVYQSFANVLSLYAQHVSAAVAGAANYNAKRLDKSDKILQTASDFAQWFQDLEKQATQKRYSRVHELKKTIIAGECNGFSVAKEWKELAARDRAALEELYQTLSEKAPFSKQSQAYKLYHHLSAVEPIVTDVLYQDNDFKAYAERGKIFMEFRLPPAQQLKSVLKGKRFAWNNVALAWQAAATDELREWVKTLAVNYEQWI